jgi:hypothetical protein
MLAAFLAPDFRLDVARWEHRGSTPAWRQRGLEAPARPSVTAHRH